MASPTNAGPATSAASMPDNTNITLRIVILAHGNRAEDDLYLVLNLETTILQLKQRIQESLAQHPLPDSLRLIYHGRPLLDAHTTLRQVLRLDQRSTSPSHVIHLVIRDQGDTDAHSVPVSLPLPLPPSTATPSMPLPTQPVPAQTHVHLPPAIGHDTHMRLHNQLHNMQHQLQHAQALRALQPSLHPQQPIPTPPRLDALPPSHIPAAPAPAPAPAPARAATNLPSQHATGMTRIEERIGPNGERITTTINNNGNTSSTSMTFRITALETPSSAPGSGPGPSLTAESQPANHPANTAPPNIHFHTQPPHLPAGFPFPPGMQLPIPIPTLMPPVFHNPLNTAPSYPATQAIAWLLSSPNGPHGIVFAPGHGFFASPSSQPSQTQQPEIVPTPTVAQGTNITTPITLPLSQAQLVLRPQDGLDQTQRPESPAPPQPGAQPQQPAHAAAAAAAAAQPAQPRRGRQADNDLLQLVLNRGWLFLRLYMFIFVMSESGTWRRILMLTSAIMFCLLPRNNPLNDAFHVARRHFDNLIGPPNIPERQPQLQQGQAAQQNQQPQPAGPNASAAHPPSPPSASPNAGRQRATLPTPEDAARRLLDQQNRRNPNPVLDLLYRLEQGVVLFLASLIPGLGERHIQAREQARRILDDENRRQQEDHDQRQQNEPIQTVGNDSNPERHDANKEDGPLPTSWASQGQEGTPEAAGTSSGIDRHAGHDDNGVRLRTGGD